MTSVIVFDHRGRTRRGCPGPLEVRITHEGRVYYIATGIKVLKNEWRAGEIVNRPDADILQERLETIGQAVMLEVNRRLAAHEPVSVAEIRHAVWGARTETRQQQAQTTFLDWFADTYPTLHLAAGTAAHYKSTLARLRTCALINSWADVTVENVLKFDAYLHSLQRKRTDAEEKMGAVAPALTDAAVYNHHKVLKAMISRAVTLGKLQGNPYDRLRGQFKRGEKETVSYLTEEEVAAFCAQRPVPGSVMAAARDLFVFQLYTGLAYGDTQVFDIKDYKKVNGKWVNVGRRIKTGVPFVSQLLPPAVEVLERYGMQLPKLDNRTYNSSLKALGMAAGISTPLHSHVARHTFATWMLKNGAKIENVSRMLGHTNITQTQRYAKVLAESVHDDFDRMDKLLKKEAAG